MSFPKYSIIIPVYNRPDEINELLDSLTKQTSKNFEIIVVEDGSVKNCRNIIEKYNQILPLTYIYQDNTGPAGARNTGATKAKGDYLIFFDSDCIIPEQYLSQVDDFLDKNSIDAFGGPDRSHQSFTDVQKAISYSMTSFITTGGIRGGKRKLDKFYPRSFNMGIKRQAFECLGGFSNLRFGEDVDFSLRIIQAGYKTALIPEAYVYHKRRTKWKQFYKQVYNSGTARITLKLLHPKSLKLVHLMPAAFVISFPVIILLSVLIHIGFILLPFLFVFLVFFHALYANKSLKVAILSIYASFIQLIGYGLGFLVAFWKSLFFKKKDLYGFKHNFYN